MTPDAIIGLPEGYPVPLLPGILFTFTCKLCGARVGLAPSGQRKREALGLDVFCLPCVLQLSVTQDVEIEGPTRSELLSDIRGKEWN